MSSFYESRDYTSLSEKVYRNLRDGIAEGRYQTGDCLTEMKIAEELGVSRTPVREALKQLELEDLVVSHPNRGVVVKGFSNEDLQDVSTIRHLLEGQAAYWAAERITPELLSELKEVVELMEFYTQKNDVEHLVQLDSRFHEIVYDASGSRTIRHILASLHHNIRKARQSSLTLPDRAGCSLAEHKKIYHAIESHDASAAKEYMESHVATAAGYRPTKK
ncbi:MAG TPA: GntR family transcriptional regulator [Eubacteriales bacterium]|nr:GntR family transcriptional regulator [Eubacteriales bacterium]